MNKKFANIILAMFLYVVFAWLGLHLSVPPIKASPIWPAAGIALAIALLRGNYCCIGTFLGSFITHGFIIRDPNLLLTTLNAWILPTAIALGAALQTYIGSRLVTAISRPPWSLDTSKQIFGICLIAGPISCICSPTISHIVLYTFGYIPVSAIPFSFFAWWAGDSIGVLLFCPLTLLLLQSSKVINLNRKLQTVPILISFCLILVYVVNLFQHRERQNILMELENSMNNFIASLDQQINFNKHNLYTLQEFLAVKSAFTAKDFANFSNIYIAQSNEISTIDWIVSLPHHQKDIFEEYATIHNNNAIKVTENADGKLIVTQQNKIYYPVLFSATKAGYPSNVGFDYAANSQAKLALSATMNNSNAQYTSPLITEDVDNAKLLLIKPLSNIIYDNKPVNGALIATLDFNQMITHLTNNLESSQIKINIEDNDTQQNIFPSKTKAPIETNSIYYYKELDVLGRSLGFRFDIPDTFLSQNVQMTSWFMLIAGFNIIGLLSCLLLFTTGQKDAIQRTVTVKTKDLNKANTILENNKNFLNSLLENLPMALLVKTPDTLEVVSANNQARKYFGNNLCGLSNKDLFSSEDFELQDSSDQEAISEQKIVAIKTTKLMVNQKAIYFSISKIPIFNSDGSIAHLLCIYEDITAKVVAEQDVARLNEKLIETSRISGMAEVANEILHNIGNVLNSVTVSSEQILVSLERVSEKKLEPIIERLKLLDTSDQEQLSLILAILAKYNEFYLFNNKQIQQEINELNLHIEHIRRVVQSQQKNSRKNLFIEQFDLVDLLNKATQFFQMPLKIYDIEHKIKASGNLQLTSDKHKLMQVFINLINNSIDSIKSTSNESRSIIINAQEITDNTISLTFADTGMGISSENLEKIFSQGFTTKETGNGLGLHSAINIIRELSGTITCASEGLGKGAIFTIVLPNKISAKHTS